MRRCLPALLVLALLAPSARAATPGTVDPTFGKGGVTSVAGLAGYRSTMALDAQGRIVLAGSANGITVTRLLPDGRLDRTFGDGGETRIGYTPPSRVAGRFDGNASVGRVFVRPDGRILVAGSAQADRAALVQLLPDGRRDRSFGRNGVLIVPFAASDANASVVLRPDGVALLVATGVRGTGGFDLKRLVVYAIGPDGESIPAYGAGGSATVAFTAAIYGSPAVLAPDGGVIAYVRGIGSSVSQVRFTPDGDPGPLVPLEGVTAPTPVPDGPDAVLLRTPGRAFGLERRTLDGVRDPSFATGPLLRGSESMATGVAADGRIVVAGVSNRDVPGDGYRGGAASLRVERLAADGTREPAYGGGPLRLPWRSNGEAAQVLFDAAGRPLVLVRRMSFGFESKGREGAAIVRLQP